MARASAIPVTASGRHFQVAEQMARYREGFVIDASVIVKWFIPQEDDHALAINLRSRLVASQLTLHAPEWVFAEVGNALRLNKRSTKESMAARLDELMEVGLTIYGFSHKRSQMANTIAWAYRLTMYDALYVALAENIGVPLITADEQLLRCLDGSPLALPLHSLA